MKSKVSQLTGIFFKKAVKKNINIGSIFEFFLFRIFFKKKRNLILHFFYRNNIFQIADL